MGGKGEGERGRERTGFSPGDGASTSPSMAEEPSHEEAGANKSSSVLESVMGVLGADDSTKALHDISALSAAQTTELVRDASNWAFRLDLKERIQQVRAQELGMLEDEPHV